MDNQFQNCAKLKERIDDWENKKSTIDSMIDYENEPLSCTLKNTHIVGRINIPKREYDGKRDLKDHLVHFITNLKLHEESKGVKCKAFPLRPK